MRRERRNKNEKMSDKLKARGEEGREEDVM